MTPVQTVRVCVDLFRTRIHQLGCGLLLAGTTLAGTTWAQDTPAAVTTPAATTPAATTPEVATDVAAQAEFFEREVRPVLLASCVECHGPQKQEADLRLDQRAHVLRQADPLIVPGDPTASRLIQAIRYAGDLQMPPNAELPEKSQAALTAWVAQGAYWPDAIPQLAASEQAAQHWAFQPLTSPALPTVVHTEWVQTAVDSFVLERLEAAQLTPSAPADRRKLIRRLFFDLVGLPPTPAEVSEFLSSNSPTAVADLVDRLLDSPQFGERWARYWLDIARYSDTKGYVFTEDRSYKYAYTYRDWVIESLNQDLPYNEFLKYQVAADQLADPSARQHLAAMGFLTVGRRFLNNPHDIIDDRIDVVTRGMMGLTVACARCHDHKYDPIPTADYYSLYGVFAASEERTTPLEEPSEKYTQELAHREQAVRDHLQNAYDQLLRESLENPTPYLVAAMAGKYSAHDSAYWQGRSEFDTAPRMIERWSRYLEQEVKPESPVFGPWHQLATVPSAEFAAAVERVCQQSTQPAGQPASANPLVLAALAEQPLSSFDGVLEVYGKLLTRVQQQWAAQLQSAAAAGHEPPTQLSDPAAEQLRQVLYGENSPTRFSLNDAERLLKRTVREERRNLQNKLAEWQNSDEAPKQAMAMLDREGSSGNPRILVRGNPNNPGDEVPRQFLRLVAGEQRQPFAHGSGRRELADAIADPQNPLTARVWVNRVWEKLLGQGLVDTPSDFGLRSSPPSHPELLDYLAARFVANRWSTKQLIRQIVLSATYQQSSDYRAECVTIDPENRLLWRAQRRRLDFEALRDSLLAVSQALDTKLLGTSADITAQPFTPRRTVYAYVDRQNLPGVFRTFDFASPDAHSPRRFLTTVPQQSLYLMNHPFALEKAQQVLQRPDVAEIADAEGRVRQLYEILYARPAAPDELELGRRFIEQAKSAKSGEADQPAAEPWVQYVQALLMTNEFCFID